MKIKITAEPQVAQEVRPEVGTVHEVEDVRKTPLDHKLYMIKTGMAQIGILDTECEVVEE